jgi:hypothetical protein
MKVDSAPQRCEQWLAQWMPLTLADNGVKVGDPLSDVTVAQNDLSLVNIAETKGRARSGSSAWSRRSTPRYANNKRIISAKGTRDSTKWSSSSP